MAELRLRKLSKQTVQFPLNRTTHWRPANPKLISDLVSQWFVIDLKANEKNTSAKKKKVPTECDKRPLFQPCKGHCMERMQIPQKAFSQSAEPLDLGTWGLHHIPENSKTRHFLVINPRVPGDSFPAGKTTCRGQTAWLFKKESQPDWLILLICYFRKLLPFLEMLMI